MRILQILLPDSGAYEQKSQRLDHAALSTSHEVLVAFSLGPFPEADVAHLYAPQTLPARRLRHIPFPYFTNAAMIQSRLPWLRGRLPASRVSPLPGDGVVVIPEAVDDSYFDQPVEKPADRGEDRLRRIGSFDRPSLRGLVEQTLGRIHRFREDVVWEQFDHAPAPEELDRLDAWIDPATDAADFDGFGAEAVVRGLPVVASSTPINRQRLENGRSGWLVPVGDPNELTHAILGVLFKPELGQNKISAAKQTKAKFRPRQRLRVLIPSYEALRP